MAEHDVYTHVGMYTGEDLLKYKSLECYQRFTAGWERDILVFAEAGDRRILNAKVSYGTEGCYVQHAYEYFVLYFRSIILKG